MMTNPEMGWRQEIKALHKALQALWREAKPEAKTAVKYNLALSFYFTLELLNQFLHWQWLKTALVIYFWVQISFGFWWAFRLRRMVLRSLADQERQAAIAKLAFALNVLDTSLDSLCDAIERELPFSRNFDLNDARTRAHCFGVTYSLLKDAEKAAQKSRKALRAIRGLD